MDFKETVKVYLEACKNKNESDSCRTCSTDTEGMAGKHGSIKTKEKKCPKCGKPMSKCVCDNECEDGECDESYDLYDEDDYVVSEDVIEESIGNKSVSKYLGKQIEKLQKAVEKSDNPEAAAEGRKAIEVFTNAKNDFEKVENNYDDGDPEAKAEYKNLKKKYARQIKGINTKKIVVLGGIGLAVAAVTAGIVALVGAYDPSAMEEIKSIKSFDDAKSTIGKIFAKVKHGLKLKFASRFNSYDHADANKNMHKFEMAEKAKEKRDAAKAVGKAKLESQGKFESQKRKFDNLAKKQKEDYSLMQDKRMEDGKTAADRRAKMFGY